MHYIYNLNLIEMIKNTHKEDLDSDFLFSMSNIQKKLYNTAKYILINESDVSDAISNTIMKAYENYHKLRSKDKFNSWIMKIMINESYKILKNNKKNNLFVSQYDLVSNHYEDNYIDLISAINSLEFKFKSVIVLFYYDDMDINTISYVLNLPKGTVKSRLYRAKKKLKEIMELD